MISLGQSNLYITQIRKNIQIIRKPHDCYESEKLSETIFENRLYFLSTKSVKRKLINEARTDTLFK